MAAHLRMRPNFSFYRKIANLGDKLICLLSTTQSPSTSKTPLTSLKKIYGRKVATSSSSAVQLEHSVNKDSLFTGLADVMMGYLFGKSKATQVAHAVWKNVVRKGDAVIDATCGNGYDTVAMLRMVADTESGPKCKGRVYAMDVQKLALENTSSLLDQHVTPDERQLVELFAMCHSQMEDVVPDNVSIRLVAFNLGYLPGGNKKIITKSDTTRVALEAAERLLAPGGLISILIYIGHTGGREEYETVQAFASGLPVENWTCCKLEMLNRPLAPVLVLLVKR